MLPIDTITKTFYIEGPATTSIATFTENNPGTILGVAFIQEKDASETAIYCGDDLFALNWAKDVPYFSANYVCSGELYITKTGNDKCLTLVNYVDRDNRQQVLQPATTTPAVENVITYGDILTSFFLLVVILGGVFGFLVNRFILRN